MIAEPNGANGDRDIQPASNLLLEAALDLARRNLYVFPVAWLENGRCACPLGAACKSPGKHPRVTNGQNAATVDEVTIRAWWTRWPTANIGLALEPSKLIAFDVDKPEGYATLDAIEREFGALSTARQRSGSGNLHVFAQKPAFPIRGDYGGITMRGANYVVAAPSLHASGGRYEWLAAPWDVPPIELPAALAEKLKRRATTPAKASTVPLDNAIQVKRARPWVAKAEPAVEGHHGESKLMAVCCKLVHGFKLNDSDALAVILDEFNPRCVPPWGDDELDEMRRKIDEARTKRTNPAAFAVVDRPRENREPRADRERTSDDVFADRDAQPDEGLPASFTVVDGVENPPTPAPDPWQAALAEALADIQAALGSATTAATRAPLFDDADVVDLLARKFAAPTWLVTGLVTRGGITTIGAEPKAAKTWLGTEIAIAVATGTKVCGEFFAERGVVAYFYAEDLDKQVRNRVRALLAGRGSNIERGRLHARPRGMFLDITKDEDLAWIVASCRKLGKIDLLVLDPLRDISSAEEDKSDAMSPVMRRLRLVAELLGCTVAIVHHAAKLSGDTPKRRPGQRLRGSGAIHGSTDSGIYLGELDGDGTTLFRNVVDSEVKGARSAGRFTLELAIEDDANGEAERATWKVDRGIPKKVSAKAKVEAEDDLAVMQFVRALKARGESLSRTAIRNHDDCPTTDHRTRDALQRLTRSGQLLLLGGNVVLREHDRGVE